MLDIKGDTRKFDYGSHVDFSVQAWTSIHNTGEPTKSLKDVCTSNMREP